jgi:hypothetical protein
MSLDSDVEEYSENTKNFDMVKAEAIAMNNSAKQKYFKINKFSVR